MYLLCIYSVFIMYLLCIYYLKSRTYNNIFLDQCITYHQII